MKIRNKSMNGIAHLESHRVVAIRSHDGCHNIDRSTDIL